MNAFLNPHWLAGAAAWYAVNGLLHDYFVLRNHNGGYDRELLRLLMDGHVLILSGALLFISWFMLRQGIVWGAIISFTTGLSMIIYCGMIFPFLKSFVTLFISIAVCLVSALIYFSMAR
jgi:hypothetical protein